MDAGTGIYRLPGVLRTQHVDLFLSHAHADHSIGLTFLLDIFAMRPIDSLTIHGDAEKLAAIRNHLFHPLIFPAGLEKLQVHLDWNAIQPGDSIHLKNGVSIQTATQERHPGSTLAMRFRLPGAPNKPEGKPFDVVYMTDTIADSNDMAAVEFARDADLLMHECNFKDVDADWAAKTGHSWTTEVARFAATAGVGQLLLTHANPLVDDPVNNDHGVENRFVSDDAYGIDVAREVFANVIGATDDLIVPLG
ncbi:MAG: MBL fold metallo-hydrolase [Planctomycetota bacterium]